MVNWVVCVVEGMEQYRQNLNQLEFGTGGFG